MTASEGDDDKEEEDEEEETKRGARTRRRKTVKFREEAENASLAVMAKRAAGAGDDDGEKVAVRDEVEKINARTSGPLAPRTNEKGVQDAREMRESADDSFATADPWGRRRRWRGKVARCRRASGARRASAESESVRTDDTKGKGGEEEDGSEGTGVVAAARVRKSDSHRIAGERAARADTAEGLA